jgi:hypothetical protein
MRLPAALCRIFRGLLPPLALAVGLLAVSALLIACSVTAENLSNDGVLSGDVAKQIWVQSVPRDSPFPTQFDLSARPRTSAVFRACGDPAERNHTFSPSRRLDGKHPRLWAWQAVDDYGRQNRAHLDLI